MQNEIGYCTNVHSGRNLDDLKLALQDNVTSLHQRLDPAAPLRVGLWLSAAVVEQLQCNDEAERFRDWLADRALVPYTLNGFPFGDFHQAVVKHAVYIPDWFTEQRLAYTLGLVQVLHRLLPPGQYGSISTLPISWGMPRPSPGRLRQAAGQFAVVIKCLDELEQRFGRRICLCIEPEPGCAIQRAEDLVDFAEHYLDPLQPPDRVRRFVGACHDICHAHVMFESQEDVWALYRRAGIHVGKVQVSSSLQATFEGSMSDSQHEQVLLELSNFAEDRYLHQTNIRIAGTLPQFFEDLPAALAAWKSWTTEGHVGLDAQWRVHFHVPIHLSSLGCLQTGQADILNCLRCMKSSLNTHLEIETYAWNVLPPPLKSASLAEGMADEVRWLTKLMTQERTLLGSKPIT